MPIAPTCSTTGSVDFSLRLSGSHFAVERLRLKSKTGSVEFSLRSSSVLPDVCSSELRLKSKLRRKGTRALVTARASVGRVAEGKRKKAKVKSNATEIALYAALRR